MGQPVARPSEDPPPRLALAPPPRKSRRRFNWRRGLRALLLAGAAIMGLFVLGVASVWIGLLIAGRDEVERVAGGAASAAPGTAAAAAQPVRVLLVGADERPGDPGRGDVAMVASVDPATKQVRLLSIPRDAWTQVPGHGWTKFNHAFAFGKEDLTRRTAERLLGVSIDHHVVVNMNGFRRMVDLLGGVTIDVEKDMKYDDPYDDPPLHINLRKGRQRLDGERALHYVRYRSDGDGDAGRIRRQQALLLAVVAEATRPQNLTKLPALISAAYGAVRTDLSAADLARLAAQIAPDASEYSFTAATLDGTDLWVDGVSYLQLDLVDVRRQAHRVLFGADPPEALVAQAQKDAQAYLASVREAGGSSTPPAVAAPGGGRNGGEVGEGSAPPAGGNGAATSGGGSRPAGPVQATAPNGMVPLRVVDASGRDAISRHRAALEAAGFRIVRVSRTSMRQATTTILWRGGPEAAVERLRAVFPRAAVVRAPSPDAATPIELVLGSD